MRTAALGLAFNHLGAVTAVTSAQQQGRIARRLPTHRLADNGVSLNDSGSGRVQLTHMRLTAQDWRTSGESTQVMVDGLERSRPWFGQESVHEDGQQIQAPSAPAS